MKSPAMVVVNRSGLDAEMRRLEHVSATFDRELACTAARLREVSLQLASLERGITQLQAAASRSRLPPNRR